MGNHEEVFLRAVDGDLRALRFLVRIGGRETLLSYGISEEEYRGLDFDELLASFQKSVPASHIAFLSAFENMIEIGDYLFVHAGVRPGVPLEAQDPHDLVWIRAPFLQSNADFGKIVVHGHTPGREPVIRGNRIGIDTGAVFTDRLTALKLEEGSRALLHADG